MSTDLAKAEVAEVSENLKRPAFDRAK